MLKKILIVIIILILLVLILPPAFFFFRAFTRPEINEIAREEAKSGEFVKLSGGYTHYETSGNKEGEVILLVHGGGSPYYVWDTIFYRLAEAGYYVIRYDQYGRGLSDRPKTRYDIELYLTQIRELMNYLQIEKPITICGHSLGGAISTLYTDYYPNKIKKLILIDPALFYYELSSSHVFNSMGSRLLKLLSGSDEEQNRFRSDEEKKRLMEFFEKSSIQYKYKGVQRAMLNAIKNFAVDKTKQSAENIGKSRLPVLLIWGERDTVVNYTNEAVLRPLIPQIEFHKIEGAGHMPQLENPDEVYAILAGFLSK